MSSKLEGVVDFVLRALSLHFEQPKAPFESMYSRFSQEPHSLHSGTV